jgi:hypothetical protein
MGFPNDSTAITPGAGATIATHVVGGKKYQVVIPAGPGGHLENSLPTYIAYVDAVAFAQNKHHISILNASGSGKIVKLQKAFAINLQLAAVTGVGVRFETRRITAHSGGSSITPEKFDSDNADLPAGITIRTGPTSVTEGNLLFAQAVQNDEAGLTGAFPTAWIQAMSNWLFESPRIQELTLREGQGITFKQITATTVGSFGWILIFTVE